MCDRVNLPVEALCDPERIARQEDPLGGIRDICAFVMRQTVVNPRWRRVFEIIFHKCEMVQDNGAIFERQRQSHQEGMVKIREHLRLSVERGQLPADIDLDLAVNAFHAAIGGVLAHWLFSPQDFDLDANAERLSDVLSTPSSIRRRCATAMCRVRWPSWTGSCPRCAKAPDTPPPARPDAPG